MALVRAWVLVFFLAFSSVLSSDSVTNVTTVYLVSSCHLDVGFANTATNIVNEYFDKYFPETIQTANDLRQRVGEERLVFTTHPYLVYLYYNCHPELGLHCPNETRLREFTEAVSRGDIVWHAFPFNAQMEFYDESLADFGFKVTRLLDSMFGKEPTITMSQRDVPGTTSSIIPILARNGVKAITVGVNTACMPPAIPSAFVWEDPYSGIDIIGMWHPHGYGGMRGISLESMVIVPGMQQALAFAIRRDNSGPPSADEVVKNYATLKQLFPQAKVIASGYDPFVNQLTAFRSQLPVYRGEIGDTWIHGIPSDPWKTAQTREVMRLRSDCISTGQCTLDDPRFFSFSGMLIKNGEHTWGKDVKTFLHDKTHWMNSEFQSVINTSNFQDMVDSWIEQRFWGLDYAIQLLADHPLRTTIEQSIQAMKFDGKISTDGYKETSDLTQTFQCGSIILKFSAETGAIDYLLDERFSVHVLYADQDHPLGQLIYQTFTADDYEQFLDDYVYDASQGYIYLDLGKPGLNGTEKMTVSPKLKSIWFKGNSSDSICSFLLESYFAPEVVVDYGGSQIVWKEITIGEELRQPLYVNFTVYLVTKTATRIPESLSFYFNPIVQNASSMVVSKLGEYLSVLDVVKNGSKHLHASDYGVSYYGRQVKFKGLDTSVICIGFPTPFPTPMQQPDTSKGFAFNICNNVWGTNYIMWYPYLQNETSSKYRFQMALPISP